MAAIKALKSKFVIVALPTGMRGSDSISPVAAMGLNNKLSGSVYPKLVITSPDQSVRYTQLSNKQLYSKADLKTAKETSIAKIEEDASRLPKPDEALHFVKQAKAGYYDQLYVGDVIDETSFMGTRQKGGKMQKMSVGSYTAGAKSYIKHLYSLKQKNAKADMDAKVKALMPKLKVETWTNTKGKPLQGKFLSLEDGQITLELPRKKKPITFSVGLLDAASKKRAEELQGQINEAKKKVEEMQNK